MSITINSEFFPIIPQISPISSVSQLDSIETQSRSVSNGFCSPIPPETPRPQSTPFFRKFSVSLYNTNSSSIVLKMLNEKLSSKNRPELQSLPSFTLESGTTKAYSVFLDSKNKLLHLSWKIKNTGNETWPEGMYIEGCERCIIPRAKPNDTVHVNGYVSWPTPRSKDFLRLAIDVKSSIFYLEKLPLSMPLETPVEKESIPSFGNIPLARIPKEKEFDLSLDGDLETCFEENLAPSLVQPN